MSELQRDLESQLTGGKNASLYKENSGIISGTHVTSRTPPRLLSCNETTTPSIFANTEVRGYEFQDVMVCNSNFVQDNATGSENEVPGYSSYYDTGASYGLNETHFLVPRMVPGQMEPHSRYYDTTNSATMTSLSEDPLQSVIVALKQRESQFLSTIEGIHGYECT